MENIGKRIRALRHARDLTQAELGRRAGLPQGTIAKVERDDSNPTRDTLQRLATALGITVAELEGEPDILDGPFPASQLRAEGLGEEYLRRYERLWGDLRREDRAWLIGHLRIVADAERRIQALEAAAHDDPPDSALPARAQGAPVFAHMISH